MFLLNFHLKYYNEMNKIIIENVFFINMKSFYQGIWNILEISNIDVKLKFSDVTALLIIEDIFNMKSSKKVSFIKL